MNTELQHADWWLRGKVVLFVGTLASSMVETEFREVLAGLIRKLLYSELRISTRIWTEETHHDFFVGQG